MPQDLFTIKRAVNLLNEKCSGAKINKVFQPSKEEINLLLYKESAFRLVISAHAEFSRVSISQTEKPNPETAYNFCMLLRKRLTGGKISSVSVFNDDRIVKISIINKNDFLEEIVYDLYAEIMGKYSNVFLTSNGVILGSVKQTPQNLDFKRVTLVGAKYVPYEKPNKLSCFSKSAKEVFTNKLNASLTDVILKNFYDFSPVTASEIAYRIETLGEYNPEKAYEIFNNFINLPSSPLVIENGGKKDFYVFDYISLKGSKTTYPDLLSAMESVFNSAETKSYLSSYKNAVSQSVKSYEKRLIKRLSALNDRVFNCRDYCKLKEFGELITQQSYLIKKGEEKALLTAYTESGEKTVEVLLDPTLTAQQNAQNYFRKYRKQKTAIELSSNQIKQTEDEFSYINTIKFALAQAENKQDFLEIKNELESAGIIKVSSAKKPKKERQHAFNFKSFSVGKFTVYVGKNNLQNDKLLSLANKNDLWFHVKDYHSSHVIAKTNGNDYPLSLIKTCAEICAYYSEGGKGEKLNVDYTERRFVKKQGGKNLGAVYYTDYKTVTVFANSHDELIIK